MSYAVKKIFTTEGTEDTGETLLSCIVQAGGDAVHGGSDGIVER